MHTNHGEEIVKVGLKKTSEMELEKSLKCCTVPYIFSGGSPPSGAPNVVVNNLYHDDIFLHGMSSVPPIMASGPPLSSANVQPIMTDDIDESSSPLPKIAMKVPKNPGRVKVHVPVLIFLLRPNLRLT